MRSVTRGETGVLEVCRDDDTYVVWLRGRDLKVEWGWEEQASVGGEHIGSQPGCETDSTARTTCEMG